MTILRATYIHRAAPDAPPVAHAGADHIALSYEARFLRRKRLRSAGGAVFLVDLPKAESLEEGDGFGLEDGRVITVLAEAEALLAVHGDLPRLAWHIGNRHTPCQIEEDRLLIQDDKVLADMLRGLGAAMKPITAPFTPEGGAYGMGRTHAHAHGHTHFGIDGTPQGGTAHKDLAAEDHSADPSHASRAPNGDAPQHAHGHAHSHAHSHSAEDHSHDHPARHHDGHAPRSHHD